MNKIIDIKELSVVNLYFVAFLLLSTITPLVLVFMSESPFSYQRLSFSLKQIPAQEVLSQYQEKYFKHKQAVQVRVVGERPSQSLEMKFNDSDLSQQLASQIDQEFSGRFILIGSTTSLKLGDLSGRIMASSLVVCLIVFGIWYTVQQKRLKKEGNAFVYSEPILWHDLLRIVLLALIALSVGILLSKLLLAFGVKLANDVQRVGELGKSEPMFLLLIAGVLAPVVEEVVFRGMMLKKLLLAKQSPWISSVLVSGLFITPHLLRLLNGGFVDKALLGTVLFVLSMSCCYAYCRYKTIIAPILVHSLFNAVNVCWWMTAYW